jgi:ABC-type nitrate/sulfonate/bicarbonate transport system substrate-binding protein
VRVFLWLGPALLSVLFVVAWATPTGLRPALASAPVAPPAEAQGPPAPFTVANGVVQAVSEAALYIALERGDFAAEGIQPELVPFGTGAAITLAVAADQIDVGWGRSTRPCSTPRVATRA